MSKQAVALKTASQVSTLLTGRRKSRGAKAAEAQRLADERFMAACREWHENQG